MRTTLVLALAALGGTLAGYGLPRAEPTGHRTARTFTICHTGGGTNCVVDGDTA